MVRIIKTVYELLPPDQRRRAVGVLALMFVTALFELGGVGAVLPFLSIATDPGIIHSNETLSRAYSMLGFETETAFIVFAAIVVIALIVLMNVASAVSLWAQVQFICGLGHSISVRLLTQYLAQPYAYFLIHNTSELGKNVLSEANRVVNGVLKPGMSLLSQGIVIVAIATLIVAVEPEITLSVMGVLGGMYGIVYGLIQRRLRRVGRQSVEANWLRYKTSSEVFGGIKAIKTLGREAYFIKQYSEASWRFAAYQTVKQLYSQLPRFLIQTIAFCALMVGFTVLVASGRDMSRAVPLLGFLGFAALRLMPAGQQILTGVAELRFHQHLLLKIHTDLMPHGRVAGLKEDSDMTFRRELRLEGVRFGYSGSHRDVIRDLSLKIPKDSSVALVGATGAGKTTLVDIILGLLVPDDGRVTVDGVPVTPENVAAWRRKVGYVPQDVVLADDTIARNIAYGLDETEIDRQAIEKAAKIAHIHDSIMTELRDGYDTVIGERGVRLSGGQRQRIGIARALYRDPDVLILDEATSDIDNVTEAYITEALQSLAGRKTLIIVAHRLTTIQGCDRIFLLELGAIVASGHYDELVATSAGFQRLARVSREAAIR